MTKTKRDIKIKNIGGRDYAYDMISYWDKGAKKVRKRSVYLGVVTNRETKEYRPKQVRERVVEEVRANEIIRNFGDSYSIVKTVENSVFGDCVRDVLPADYGTLMSLVCHKLIRTAAMQYVKSWSQGNVVSSLFGEVDLSSQRISDFLKKLGCERVWRRFFNSYIGRIAGEKVGVIIDSTGLPNEISIPLSAWGYHGGDSERETRLMMVVDRISGRPLYFRYMAGNIVDVSTLTHTIAELTHMGVKTLFALIDAGYYSEENIRNLYQNNISFMTRLPAGRTLYKTLINVHPDVEHLDNAVAYGKRALFVKCVKIDLFGNPGYAYIVCDIKRKADEITKTIIAAKEDKATTETTKCELTEKGKFIIISSDQFPIQEVIPLYYTRQSCENLFGISKSYLDLLPLRTHSIETMRGYLMLTFISLIIYLEMKTKLGDKFTVEAALTEMGNLMCKTYDNKILICEPTKNMKAISKLLGFMVPMHLGV